ncbi:MAG: carbamoyltransferase HypF, partial [Deltaproteobacteria bacterium]
RFLKSKSGFVKNINRDNWKILRQMYFSGFNSPLASSMGRLFDAAASLILGKSRAGFEAELAIRLEKAAGDFKTQPHPYAFHIFREGAGYVIDPLTTFRQIMTDLNAGKSKQEMASRFHFTVARMICEVCALLRKSSKINIVALSGGVFQNNLLLGMALDLLYKSGFEVVFHKKLSCNDSGVSLGQAVIANFS